jgi:hypothetical protein
MRTSGRYCWSISLLAEDMVDVRPRSTASTLVADPNHPLVAAEE